MARGTEFAEDLLFADVGDGVDVTPAREELLADVDAEAWEALRLGLADYVRKNGFSSVVLGLSGGIDSALVLAPGGLPFELCRRLTARCIERLDPDAEPRGQVLIRAIRALESGERAMLGNVIATPNAAREAPPAWHFRLAPPRRAP